MAIEFKEFKINQDEIIPVFQPIYRLDNLEIVAHEALARTVSGVIPEKLFKMARREKKVQQLDKACITQAVKYAPKKGLIFININPLTFLSIAQNKHYEKWFLKTVPQNRAVIEITETQRLGKNLEQMLGFFKKIKAQGYCVAIDDVSSGYNRLQLIIRLRPEYVKLDKEIISGYHKNRRQMAVISLFAALGRDLGFRLIAEHIETPEELEAVREVGVQCGQGFYLSEPIQYYKGGRGNV